MRQLELLARLYVHPYSAMSAILDEGSWIFGAVLVLLLSGVLQYTLVTKPVETVRALVHPAADEGPGPPEREQLAPHLDEFSAQAWRVMAANRFSIFNSLLG